MAKFELKIEGLDYLVKRFQTAPKTVDAKLSSKISKYLGMMEREAKQNAPYDTGALRESIRAYRLKNPISGLLVAGNPDRFNGHNRRVIYAGYQEFGVGKGFHIPGFHTINRSSVFNYAYLFINRNTLKKSNVPYRSFMFTALDNNYEKMLRDIATIEI